MADRMIFHKTARTGGAADSLDNISGTDRGDGNPLQTNDCTFVMDGSLYIYLFAAASMDAESDPDIIKPDDISGANPGRWILQGISATLADASVTLAKMADMATASLIYRKTAAAGVPEVNTLATLKTDLGLTGTNSGDETAARIATIITGAGPETTPLDADEFPFYKIVGTVLKKVTWANIIVTLKAYFDGIYNYVHPSGDGNLHVPANSTTNNGKVLTAAAAAGTYTWETPSAASVADESITNAKLAHIATATIKGRVTAGTGDVEDLTAANVRTIINVADGATANDMTAPGTIGGTTPGVIYGWNKEIYKTANADSPLTALQCSGTIVSNYGMTDADCVIDLPTAAEGLSFVCVLPAVRARYFRLRCPSAQADKIYLLGVAGSDDGYVGVASGYATGASCSMFTFKASDGGFDWMVIPIFGTWVAG
jgi:hypothetical protein